MNKLLTKCCLATLLLAGLGVATTAKAGKEKQVYIPMDYSTCGYHASETAIPDVAIAVYVDCGDGDMHDLLKMEID